MDANAVAEVERAPVAAASEGAGGAPGRSRGFRVATAVVVGVLVGVGLAVTVPRLLGGSDEPGGGAINPETMVSRPAATSDAVRGSGTPPPGVVAGSAETAVTGFLNAEVARDFEASFGFLSDEDRGRYGSPAAWVSAHADVLPPVRSFAVEEVNAAEVVTLVDLEARLDQVTGLTPGRARITWAVTTGPDGHGVALERSTVEALHPPDDGAVDAARRWARARQACGSPAEERAGLIGFPALADGLCQLEGTASVGEPEPLDAIATSSVATAFGPEAAAAARVVRISGPIDLAAVLAPIGERWTVIGVVP